MRSLLLFALLMTGLEGFSQTLMLPARSPLAKNGTEVISMLEPLSLSAREDSIFLEVIGGNVPDFLRNLIPISDTVNISGTDHIVQYFVIPDYLALGCDSDYFLCPMTPLLAQRICSYAGYSMPTRKMVNDIWTQSTVKLSPQPISPTPQMTTVPVFADHDSMVWNSRSAQLMAHPLGELVGGDKKDVIISNEIYGHPSPGRVVIYGWHQLNGVPIQNLYYGHEETYADYSHGIRLVQNELLVDGSMTTIQEVLTSSTLYTLLSDEGTIAVPNYPVTGYTIPKPVSFCALREGNDGLRVRCKHDAGIAGYRISFSSDGESFGMPEYFSGNETVYTGLTTDATYFFRLAATGLDGGISPYSEVLGIATGIESFFPILIVNGFDRPSAGNTYDFVVEHGKAVQNNTLIPGVFASATNEAVTDSLIDLSDYHVVDYILGEESTVNETFSALEQQMISDYLANGYYESGLIVSGSEIGWDLDHLGSAQDQLFYNSILGAEYIDDAPGGLASTTYSVEDYFWGLDTVWFDDGTHGSYNVDWPDVINPIYGSCIQYYTGGNLECAGIMTNICNPVLGTTVYLAYPFETVYPESARNALMGELLHSFTCMCQSEITDKPEIFVKAFPSPADKECTIQIHSETGGFFTVTIFDITGKVQIQRTALHQPGDKWEMIIGTQYLPAGIYQVVVQGEGKPAKGKIVVLH